MEVGFFTAESCGASPDIMCTHDPISVIAATRGRWAQLAAVAALVIVVMARTLGTAAISVIGLVRTTAQSSPCSLYGPLSFVLLFVSHMVLANLRQDGFLPQYAGFEMDLGGAWVALILATLVTLVLTGVEAATITQSALDSGQNLKAWTLAFAVLSCVGSAIAATTPDVLHSRIDSLRGGGANGVPFVTMAFFGSSVCVGLECLGGQTNSNMCFGGGAMMTAAFVFCVGGALGGVVTLALAAYETSCHPIPSHRRYLLPTVATATLVLLVVANCLLAGVKSDWSLALATPSATCTWSLGLNVTRSMFTSPHAEIGTSWTALIVSTVAMAVVVAVVTGFCVPPLAESTLNEAAAGVATPNDEAQPNSPVVGTGQELALDEAMTVLNMQPPAERVEAG